MHRTLDRILLPFISRDSHKKCSLWITYKDLANGHLRNQHKYKFLNSTIIAMKHLYAQGPMLQGVFKGIFDEKVFK